MIQPDDIRRKAEKLYAKFLQSWLEGSTGLFPYEIRGLKIPKHGDISKARESMLRLREGSTEFATHSYHVTWKKKSHRRLGLNEYPIKIVFKTQEAFLGFIDKQHEFDALSVAVTRLRTLHPELEPWLWKHARQLVDLGCELDGLICVLQYFRDNPRPDRFARELPLPVDTKFIERHRGLLRRWLDLVLPPHAVRSDEKHFARRYGLRYAEPHLRVRLLDSALMPEFGMPYDEFSLPLHTLEKLPVREATVFVVENKVNLLTLPPLRRGIGLGGLGAHVTILRDIPWLAATKIVYWGDLDVEGFRILSSLRAIFPETLSLFMDDRALDRYLVLGISGNASQGACPPCLKPDEQAAFMRCQQDNVRIEQERVPQADVLDEFRRRRESI